MSRQRAYNIRKRQIDRSQEQVTGYEQNQDKRDPQFFHQHKDKRKTVGTKKHLSLHVFNQNTVNFEKVSFINFLYFSLLRAVCPGG